MNKELKKYVESIDGVSHITFDPKGPDVVRIHLIPPKKVKPGIAWVIIINGQDMLPIGFAWAILLREFINNATPYDGKPITDVEKSTIIKKTAKTMLTLFPNTKETKIKRDLLDLLDTILDLSKGKIIEDIGFLTMKEYGNFMKAPHRVDLMVSSMELDGRWNCNQKCLHCYAAGQTLANSEEISTDDWKTIIDKLKKACVSQITFTGGEPTMRYDLAELVRYSDWFITRLNTNGIRMTPALCKELYEASLDSVQFTLYSHKKAVHNLLVGSDHFDETVQGIKNAIKAGLNVSINTPLCSLNSDYRDMIEWAYKELKVRYFTCSGLIISGNAMKDDSKETRLDEKQMLQILTESVQYARDCEADVQFTSPGWIDEKLLRKLKLNPPSCGACLTNMAVTPSGKLVPCQSWLNQEDLGDLLLNNFSTIWRSRRCKIIRNRSAKVDYMCQLRKMNESKNNKKEEE